MKLNLLSCDALKPDRRAIAKCIVEVSSNINESLSNELTDILLEGDAVDIEIEDKNSGSALRALRKLNIDYEIVEWTSLVSRFFSIISKSYLLKTLTTSLVRKKSCKTISCNSLWHNYNYLIFFKFH